jgi:hypothetical protein
MVFAGCPSAPESHCGNAEGTTPVTNVNETPGIAEKPYISTENLGTKLYLVVPSFKNATSGADFD